MSSLGRLVDIASPRKGRRYKGVSPMNDTRQRVLDFVRSCEHSPSIREIGEAVGLSSSSTVANHVQKLREMGLLKPAGRSKPRCIIATHQDLPDLLTTEEREYVESARASLAEMPSHPTAALLAIIDRLTEER